MADSPDLTDSELINASESARLAALRGYGILDTPADPRFDRITAMAARLLGMPLALVTLIDESRQWFKSRAGALEGLRSDETSRDISFCARAIDNSAILEVPDAAADPRFAAYSVVTGPPHIRFYAGKPLIDPAGHALGTLCVIDTKPNRLDEAGRQLLTELAGIVLDELLLHRARFEAEQARREAEFATKAKSDFLAFMSHELRTPLNAVIGFGELMGAEPFGELGSPRYKHYATMIVEGGQHLLAVINAILDMSAIEAGATELRPKLIHPADEIAAVLDLVRHQCEVKALELNGPEDADSLPDLRADPAALRQMLLNLLGNAIKFTPPGGAVALAARVEAGMLRIDISDTGIGMTDDEVAKLGEPFYQASPSLSRRAEGIGLGLVITKRLAALHGGQLLFASEPDQGTTASLLLPLPPQR